MKIQEISLKNVRQFTDRVSIKDIGSGLNVLTASNEAGKSTFFDALHAVFYFPHRSWKQKEAKLLEPRAGGDPEVSVAFQQGDTHWRIEKRWSHTASHREAKLYRNDVLLAQAGEAEEKLSEMMGVSAEGGPAGLLWVRQGVIEMSETGDEQETRRGIMDSVAGEVEAMTGGRRMEDALKVVRASLDAQLTMRGAKKGSELANLMDEVEDLEDQHSQLADLVNAQQSDLERRRGLRVELAEVTDPEARHNDEQAAQTAAEALEAAKAHDEKVKTAEAGVAAKEAQEVALREKAQGLAQMLQEGRDALSAREAAEEVLEQATGALSEAEADLNAKRGADKGAGEALTEIGEQLRSVLRAQGAAAARNQRKVLGKRLENAEKLRGEIETLTAEIGLKLPEKSLEHLEALESDMKLAVRARESAAASFNLQYDAGCEGRVTRDGEAVLGSIDHPVPEGALLALEGIGQIEILPGAGGDEIGVEIAREALNAALTELGLDDMSEARASAAGRKADEDQLRGKKAELSALVPDGINTLRAEIAALPEPMEGAEDLPSLEEVETSESVAKSEKDRTAQALEEAQSAFDAARDEKGRLDGEAIAAQERWLRAEAALKVFENPEAEKAQLLKQANTLSGELLAARTALAELQKEAPNLETAKAAAMRTQSVLEASKARAATLEKELATLDGAIGQRGSKGIEEELETVSGRLEGAQDRLKAMQFDLKVNQRLVQALEEAQSRARDRHVAPVVKELVPLLRLIWPDAEPVIDAETGMISSITRRSIEEEFDILSGGTREQISLLVRLAFARILAREGRPAPVILDDAIVYTDDERIEQMFNALTQQSQDVQIIVFSCRQRAFRSLGGNPLAIERGEAA